MRTSISKIICSITLLILICYTLSKGRHLTENLIPYETALTLPPPCKSIITATNPMPNSQYGPYPPYRNMMP